MWQIQYDTTKGDDVDYNTPEFRGLFSSWWSGWNRTGDPHDRVNHHPVFGYDATNYYQSVTRGSRVEHDMEHVIFKMEFMSWMFDELKQEELAEWRVLPMPRATEDVERNYFLTHYAVINPYGKNRELAMEYLEALAINMLDVVARPGFVLKDITEYEGYFDIETPVIQDLHEVFRHGGAGRTYDDRLTPQYDFITDFQNGKITLDEALRIMQTRADMWLGR